MGVDAGKIAIGPFACGEREYLRWCPRQEYWITCRGVVLSPIMDGMGGRRSW